ncbi:acyl-CoA N-acyltransferase [Sordaria brevicollis]|uniref:Acyl-CoA N-acyltransferase n=1 Tax=Sordaria brevicollis TaxID=83679 RepID=A0AAE0UF53_SORBR|nr:acyl-CoA N-acyltransferase [Sordaria brevicollis]
MVPQDQIRTWTREVGNTIYTYSTDPSLVDLTALNAALASDTVWWGRDMPEEALKRMVEHSFNFGLYVREKVESENGNSTKEQGEMVGFARLITDYVTFGYLTDVYVLPEYQGKGLGAWMMECMNEALEQWPELRRVVLFTGDAYAAKMYGRTLGMKDTRENGGKLMVMQKIGPAAVRKRTDLD